MSTIRRHPSTAPGPGAQLRATLQNSSLSTAEATLLVDSLDGDRLAGFTLLDLR